ncbi:hypothetical protein H696_01985 [Fonticula alba]|uniref:Uncharacterized protein n=1 Tax=Fonticula alba TaxID=691883 RepID=A0A058ZC74_FONAL|nr:hypothetical protein H696_01985 [Fonticula alba]KCV71037.1 hypothetical protein H696_01985 [Fonticula alba]|eukprot:XP_009494160.1 hypothetical protein H696_01985 [Fonticula alba]
MDFLLTAALGNTWAHAVNTRLSVDYSLAGPSGIAPSAGDRPTARLSAPRRWIDVAKSPVAPHARSTYVITDRGFDIGS